MSSPSALGISTDLVQPVATSPVAIYVPAQHQDDIPELAPVPRSASQALVAVEQRPASPWWKFWDSRPAGPKPTDEPYWPDATRAAAALLGLRNQLNYIHANLTNDTWLGGYRQAGDPFMPADALRASVVASLAGLKHRLDEGAAAGAAAALSGHSRAEFLRITTELRAMDAERRPLEKTAADRHAQLKEAAERLAKEQADAADRLANERAAAERATREKTAELQALTPDERDRLMTRIDQVRALGFAFARYAHTSPEWKQDADHDAFPTNMVLPQLTLRGSVDFNALWPNTNYLKFEGWKRITSRAELEDVLDSVLGRDPAKRIE